jgi:hypothetical protein
MPARPSGRSMMYFEMNVNESEDIKKEKESLIFYQSVLNGGAKFLFRVNYRIVKNLIIIFNFCYLKRGY